MNFGLGWIANALVIALADLNRYGGQLASLYCLMCLPVSALVFCVGAWLGAEQAEQTESSRTAGAVVSSALSVTAFLSGWAVEAVSAVGGSQAARPDGLGFGYFARQSASTLETRRRG